jgi:hypothetical protein
MAIVSVSRSYCLVPVRLESIQKCTEQPSSTVRMINGTDAKDMTVHLQEAWLMLK